MSGDEKTTFYDSLVNRIKNNKVLAIGLLVVVIVTTGAGMLFDLYEKLIGVTSPTLRLEAMNVDPASKVPFRDGPGIPCLLQDKVMRTFDASEHGPNSPLTLAFAFANRAKHDALFTAADFVVSHTQQVAGGGPGVVAPNHTYKMFLAFKRGTQTLVLNSPYRIPANDIGSFAIDILPDGEGVGLCWVLHIEFKTSLGTIKTEPFAVTMSKTR